MPKIDSKRIYNNATNFYKASEILGQHFPHQVQPFIVNMSFSLELYLKCLTVLDGKEIKREHRLLKLYKELSSESMKAIENKFNILNYKQYIFVHELKKKFGVDQEFSISKILGEIDNSFLNWRYGFEGKLNDFYGVESIIAAVNERIFEIMPELKANSPKFYK